MDLQEIILGAEVSSVSQADDWSLFVLQVYALQDHEFSLDMVALSKLNELFTKNW